MIPGIQTLGRSGSLLRLAESGFRGFQLRRGHAPNPERIWTPARQQSVDFERKASYTNRTPLVITNDSADWRRNEWTITTAAVFIYLVAQISRFMSRQRYRLFSSILWYLVRPLAMRRVNSAADSGRISWNASTPRGVLMQNSTRVLLVVCLRALVVIFIFYFYYRRLN